MVSPPALFSSGFSLPLHVQADPIDEGRIQEHLGEVVRSTVEETLNAMLDAELRNRSRSAIEGGHEAIQASTTRIYREMRGTVPGQHPYVFLDGLWRKRSGVAKRAKLSQKKGAGRTDLHPET